MLPIFMFLGIYRFVSIEKAKNAYLFTSYMQEILLHQIPITLLIVYNNIALKKPYHDFDTTIFCFCGLNIVQVIVEWSYYKCNLNKGINLEQRVEMPFKFRFMEYVRLFLISASCAAIVIPCSVYLVDKQPCNIGFYNSPGSVECIPC